jgi:hypothetical protein
MPIRGHLSVRLPVPVSPVEALVAALVMVLCGISVVWLMRTLAPGRRRVYLLGTNPKAGLSPQGGDPE